jgi:hypothetical protein
MIVTMITEDSSITVDGDQLTIPVAATLGEWAVQFDGENAEVEYGDSRANEVINAATFYARYQSDIDAHAAERLALNEAAADALAQPAPVPASVSRFQARAALLQSGLLATAESAIQDADAMTQMVWADAQEFRRASPTVAAIAGVLSLTDSEVDDLFRLAITIKA